MSYNGGISDLSNFWFMTRKSRDLRTDMDLRAREFSTGEKNGKDITRAGETDRMVAIDRSIDLIAEYSKAVGNGALRAETMQSSLDAIRQGTQNIMLGVLSSLGSGSFANTIIQANGANEELSDVVAKLNANVAGQSLFSGAAVDQAAVTDANTMLADVEAILAAAPDVPTALANVDFYFFDPAGGYMTGIYTGSSLPGPDVSVGEGEQVSIDIRADSVSIRETLRHLSLVAAVSNGAFAGTQSQQELLLQDAADGNLNTANSLVTLQESLGYSEERLAARDTELNAEKMSLELARNRIATVDPYEAAARFQELEGLVDRLYTVTARLSSLSLANFLR